MSDIEEGPETEKAKLLGNADMITTRRRVTSQGSGEAPVTSSLARGYRRKDESSWLIPALSVSALISVLLLLYFVLFSGGSSGGKDNSKSQTRVYGSASESVKRPFMRGAADLIAKGPKDEVNVGVVAEKQQDLDREAMLNERREQLAQLRQDFGPDADSPQQRGKRQRSELHPDNLWNHPPAESDDSGSGGRKREPREGWAQVMEDRDRDRKSMFDRNRRAGVAFPDDDDGGDTVLSDIKSDQSEMRDKMMDLRQQLRDTRDKEEKTAIMEQLRQLRVDQRERMASHRGRIKEGIGMRDRIGNWKDADKRQRTGMRDRMKQDSFGGDDFAENREEISQRMDRMRDALPGGLDEDSIAARRDELLARREAHGVDNDMELDRVRFERMRESRGQRDSIQDSDERRRKRGDSSSGERQHFGGAVPDSGRFGGRGDRGDSGGFFGRSGGRFSDRSAGGFGRKRDARRPDLNRMKDDKMLPLRSRKKKRDTRCRDVGGEAVCGSALDNNECETLSGICDLTCGLCSPEDDDEEDDVNMIDDGVLPVGRGGRVLSSDELADDIMGLGTSDSNEKPKRKVIRRIRRNSDKYYQDSSNMFEEENDWMEDVIDEVRIAKDLKTHKLSKADLRSAPKGFYINDNIGKGKKGFYVVDEDKDEESKKRL